MKCIEIFIRVLEAERTSDWKLHLNVAHELIPFFFASRHYLYAKSTFLYFQTMLNLETTNPDIYKLFEKGYHTIRRSDPLWAGLSPDLFIEQVLMPSIKTVGGLIRGRGLNDLQRAIWLLSTPAVAEVNRAIQEFTEVTYATSDQHKEVSNSRIERDHNDSVKVAEYFLERFPFGQGRELINIDNGEVAHSSTNVYQAEEVAKRMMKEIVSLFLTILLRRKILFLRCLVNRW